MCTEESKAVLSCSPRENDMDEHDDNIPGNRRNLFDGISLSQVCGTAMAAVTATILSSQIGIAGSVIGIVVASIISNMASKMYANMIHNSAHAVMDKKTASQQSRSGDMTMSESICEQDTQPIARNTRLDNTMKMPVMSRKARRKQWLI